MALPPFDKYDFYHRSVQSPDTDADFLYQTYKDLRGVAPKVLGEDFCGTAQICASWVKKDPTLQAVGVDLDPEPIEYGAQHVLSKLTSEQKQRVRILKDDVRGSLPSIDVLCALNFSYFCFKERRDLVHYFSQARKRLTEGKGIFVLDIFGGSQCYEANEEETEHEEDGFSYFWDQDTLNPTNNHVQFHIHFQRKGEKKRERVFTYDWRFWSIPEIRDILIDAGFQKTTVYWEGTDEDGEGDGEFTPTSEGEECESWVAYIVAEA